MEKILITGIGSKIGVAILNSLRMSKLDIEIIGTDMESFNPGFFACDKSYIVPGAHEDSYLDEILSICKRENIGMVIPGTDVEIPKLSQLKGALGARPLVLVGTEDAVEICRRKKRSYEFFSERECPFAMTVDYEDVERLIEEKGFPILAKPAVEDGSIRPKIIFNMNELERFEHKADHVFQEYLVPASWNMDKKDIRPEHLLSGDNIIKRDDISIQVLISKKGEAFGTFISRNSLKFGMSMQIFPFRSRRVRLMAQKMAGHLADEGLIGPCNFQCKITEKGLVCFNVIPRFTSLSQVRSQLRFNECEAIIRHFMFGDEPFEIESLKTEYEYVCCRYLDAVRYRKKDLDELNSEGFIQNKDMVTGD